MLVALLNEVLRRQYCDMDVRMTTAQGSATDVEIHPMPSNWSRMLQLQYTWSFQQSLQVYSKVRCDATTERTAWLCNKRMLNLWQSLPERTRNTSQLQYLSDRKHQAKEKSARKSWPKYKSQQTSVIHMVHLPCKVDTGAEVNVISKDYDRPGPNPQQRHLGPTQYRYTVKYRIRRLHYQHPWNLHCTSINMAISKIIYYILE